MAFIPSVLLVASIFVGIVGAGIIVILGLFWIVEKLGGDISEPQDVLGTFLLFVIFIVLTAWCYDYLNEIW
jgi:hypothetical protein